tara:strand:- start:2387 stop:2581 length:195 start_codon:yes stop_codon:yes gene_type:complete
MASPVQDPSKITVVAIEGTMADIHTSVQTYLRANLAGNDTLYELNIVRNIHDNRVVCYIMYEDQ